MVTIVTIPDFLLKVILFYVALLHGVTKITTNEYKYKLVTFQSLSALVLNKVKGQKCSVCIVGK